MINPYHLAHVADAIDRIQGTPAHGPYRNPDFDRVAEQAFALLSESESLRHFVDLYDESDCPQSELDSTVRAAMGL